MAKLLTHSIYFKKICAFNLNQFLLQTYKVQEKAIMTEDTIQCISLYIGFEVYFITVPQNISESDNRANKISRAAHLILYKEG